MARKDRPTETSASARPATNMPAGKKPASTKPASAKPARKSGGTSATRAATPVEAPATTSSRKRRSPAEIRERLIRAAGDEFRRYGFAGATTAAIARSADVTEAQLFRYYATKADLFREAVFEPLNAHFAEFNARNQNNGLASGVDRDRARRLYVNELQAFLDEHSKLLASLIVAQTFTSGSLQGVGDIDSLRNYFERGAAMMSNRIQENPAVDPRLLVRVSFAAVLGCVMFKEWIFPAGFAPEETINAAIFDFVIDGINVNSGSHGRLPTPAVAGKAKVASKKKAVRKPAGERSEKNSRK